MFFEFAAIIIIIVIHVNGKAGRYIYVSLDPFLLFQGYSHVSNTHCTNMLLL